MMLFGFAFVSLCLSLVYYVGFGFRISWWVVAVA